MCDAMQPILQKSLQDYQDVDSRLVLAAANIDNLGEQVMAVLPSDTKFNLEKNGCQPLFLLLRVCLYFNIALCVCLDFTENFVIYYA